MLKVFVLGASGLYGGATAKLLADNEEVGVVAIAGRHTETLTPLAGDIGDKASIVTVDALDRSALGAAIKGFDVIVNSTGYYEQLLEPVLGAAIDAGVNYVDISESTEAAELAFAQDRAARDAGITAIHGIGSTPGVTSLLGVYAADQLDHCYQVSCGFVVAASAYFPDDTSVVEIMRKRDIPQAVHATIIEVMSAKVQVIKQGKPEIVDPMSGRFQVPLPQGVDVTVYPIAMSPPLTLYKKLPEAREIASCMAFLPDNINTILYKHAQDHARGKVDLNTAVCNLFEELGTLPAEQRALAEGVPAYAQWAHALGEIDGSRKQVSVSLAEPLATETAFAAGALGVARSEITGLGVLPPEACFEPLAFFDAVSQLGYGRPYNRESILIQVSDV